MEISKIKSKYSNFNENIGIFLHSLYMIDEHTLEIIRNIKKNNNVFFTVHVAETLHTEEKVKDLWNGMSSVEVLEKYSLLDDKTLLVHGCYFNSLDIDIIAKRNVLLQSAQYLIQMLVRKF